MKDDYYKFSKFSLPHLYIFSLKGREDVLFELRSERVGLAYNNVVFSQRGQQYCKSNIPLPFIDDGSISAPMLFT